ncbi:carboxylesterase family protein [Nodularia spumigena]|uniref:carboxylesterase family protein n=1 Tax=Nodularia spumigena TaxID=70799 RepID=UPI002B21406F|nr:prolyl oligopeptidase family serine peptidase [Nodularia spumigena]MEA5614540.1 prolyl oligopeptidase family serine peptidase [Nodularia spumigena UHCC 0040]
MLATHLAAMAATIVFSRSDSLPQPDGGGAVAASVPEVRVIDYRTEWEGRTYAWSVMIPPGATEGGAGLLFLHGYGECGDDGKKNLAVGLPPAVRKNPERWPMVIIVPQKPVHNSEWEDHEAAVLAILDDAAEKGHYDPEHLAITGLSQGGHGTIWFAANHADRFKAAAPVCGYIDRRFDDNNTRMAVRGATPDSPGTIATAEKLKAMPLWLFHGGKDDVVPPGESRSLFAALGSPKKDDPGALACYTEFPDANHNSWDAAYGDPELAAWLVRHTR